MSRIPFEQLPAEVRQAVADKTGAAHQAVTAPGGMNSGIASVLDTDSGPVFVKGIPADHPQVGAQRREAAAAAHLPPPRAWVAGSVRCGVVRGLLGLSARPASPSARHRFTHLYAVGREIRISAAT